MGSRRRDGVGSLTGPSEAATFSTVDLHDAGARGLNLTKPLDVRDLPSEGLRYDHELPAEFVLQLLGSAATRGPVRFDVEGAGRATVDVLPLSPEDGPPVRIRGTLSAHLLTSCVRCLEPVRLELTVPVDATLFANLDPLEGVGQAGPAAPNPKEDQLDPWSEQFPEPDRLAEDAYDGQMVPLPHVLQQALLIEVPTDPVCLEEGPCSERTEALITQANAASEAADAEGDPRWAALRALRAAQDSQD